VADGSIHYGSQRTSIAKPEGIDPTVAQWRVWDQELQWASFTRSVALRQTGEQRVASFNSPLRSPDAKQP